MPNSVANTPARCSWRVGRGSGSRWEHHLPYFWKVAPHLALTEEGPQAVVHRHLESIRMLAARA